jgi:hypothetical protein
MWDSQLPRGTPEWIVLSDGEPTVVEIEAGNDSILLATEGERPSWKLTHAFRIERGGLICLDGCKRDAGPVADWLASVTAVYYKQRVNVHMRLSFAVYQAPPGVPVTVDPDSGSFDGTIQAGAINDLELPKGTASEARSFRVTAVSADGDNSKPQLKLVSQPGPEGSRRTQDWLINEGSVTVFFGGHYQLCAYRTDYDAPACDPQRGDRRVMAPGLVHINIQSGPPSLPDGLTQVVVGTGYPVLVEPGAKLRATIDDNRAVGDKELHMYLLNDRGAAVDDDNDPTPIEVATSKPGKYLLCVTRQRRAARDCQTSVAGNVPVERIPVTINRH